MIFYYYWSPLNVIWKGGGVLQTKTEDGGLGMEEGRNLGYRCITYNFDRQCVVSLRISIMFDFTLNFSTVYISMVKKYKNYLRKLKRMKIFFFTYYVYSLSTFNVKSKIKSVRRQQRKHIGLWYARLGNI